MKKTGKVLGALATGLVLWGASVQAQTIRIVDNNINAPTGAEVYSTLQAANNAADPNDIVHVIGSPSGYAGATIDRPLKIYGIGPNPDKDMPHVSRFDSQIILSTAASGTLIEGLWMNTSGHIRLDNTVSHVAIRKCFFFNTAQIYEQHNEPKSNILIESNIIDGNNSTCITIDYVGNQHIVVRNNLLIGVAYVANGQIINNVFATNNAAVVGIQGTTNTLVFNNVFFKSQPVHTTTNFNCIYKNNISVGSNNDALPMPGAPINTNIGEANKNEAILGIPISTTGFFVNYPDAGDSNWDPSYDFHLGAGNPGIGMGTDGTNMGMFGGVSPFDQRVDLPSIQVLNTGAHINEDAVLPVTVEATTN